jgi:hypothetical protein
VTAAAIVLVTAASALLIAPIPTYDPWMWLLWGRETASLSLSTVEGPAFKPLPVAVCAVLSLLGPAAPMAWVLIARAGAVVAVFVAYRALGALGAAAVATKKTLCRAMNATCFSVRASVNSDTARRLRPPCRRR